MAIIVKCTLPITNILLEDFTTVLEMVPSTKVAARVTRSGGLTLVVEHGDGLLHDMMSAESSVDLVLATGVTVRAGVHRSSMMGEKDAAP